MFKHIYILFVILFVIACGDSSPQYIDELEIRPARSEKEFALNPNLKTIPGCVIVGQLETKFYQSSDSTDTNFDSKVGFDVIPISFEKDDEFSYRLDENALFTVKLINESNLELFTLNKLNLTVKLNIPKGNYKYVLENIATADTSYKIKLPYFIQPDYQNLNMAEISKNPQTTIYKAIDKSTFFTSKSCRYCDLKKVDLSAMFLSNIDFSYSSCKSTNFSNCKLDNSKFNGSNLNNANFYKASMRNTILDSLYDFSHATFEKSNLENVTFTNSYSRYANFFAATIKNSNFTGTTLNKAKMYGATIINTVIENVNLSESDMSYSTFENSKAIGANFCNTNRNNWVATNLLVDETTMCIPADTTKK